MTEFKKNLSGLLRVFVYGTLKPGEANYKSYCEGKVINATEAFALGKLFALPVGYPAMTLGHRPVYGYLLEFSSVDVLAELDELEDYYPARSTSENLYNRQQIKIYDLQGRSLGWVWVYLMTPELVSNLGGTFLPDGCWSNNYK
ncbi:gamma-glutamylcyclotransferase [Chlorogloeopsis sp. ULAP01]|uniref:gamma-glutamylcyclotransferase family protein n=1 Tax=Chlorogloeopsis sp. ULAP01 TaxID=3056483 RepID=UPI0025AA60E8|nr:gamma-glutamylcyclotransferase [Chlorogloeopsis sp. ULAP01]MDM9379501.1 gamma-glutamylcyclotransferase [Chlorogloeopsis sp. ULAP01]